MSSPVKPPPPSSSPELADEDPEADAAAAAAFVAFFRGLPSEARVEYTALAELDRRFGEDVEAEHRERAAASAGPGGVTEPGGGKS